MVDLKVLNYTFQNLSQKNMSFNQVFHYIRQFMEKDPTGCYKLMFGTDSQIHPGHTRFITGLVIHCERKGAWACIRKVIIPRKMLNLHERISLETTLTEEVVSMFTEDKKEELIILFCPIYIRGLPLPLRGISTSAQAAETRPRSLWMKWFCGWNH